MLRATTKPHTTIRIKTQFPYEIAIPTGNNPVLLRDTTLNILKSYRVPYTKITVFVPSIIQEKLYKSILLPNSYGKIWNTSSKSFAEQYNQIYSYYTPGTQIIFIKDCIQSIVEYFPNCLDTVRPLRSFLGLCKLGFQTCIKEKSHIWGICPTVSSIKPTITTSLIYIPGSLWGTILPPSSTIHLTQNYKEDYERTIQYYKADKSVIRLTMVSAIECIQPVNLDGIKQSVKYLIQQYPEYILQKKSNPLELVFRAQRNESDN